MFETINAIRKVMTNRIKSDQNGIESKRGLHEQTARYDDKIRPKWDWKLRKGFLFLCTLSRIKSDQNGIERVERCYRQYYQQKIKSDQNGIERISIASKTSSKISLIKSDQNGIESFKPDYLISILQDKIRPKWDWKFTTNVKSFVKTYKIKSDQNGIERQNLSGTVNYKGTKIKSDQNGIESLKS